MMTKGLQNITRKHLAGENDVYRYIAKHLLNIKLQAKISFIFQELSTRTDLTIMKDTSFSTYFTFFKKQLKLFHKPEIDLLFT